MSRTAVRAGQLPARAPAKFAARSPAKARSQEDASSQSLRAAILRYMAASEQPLASLLFVLPLIIVYEVGTRWYGTDPAHGTEQRVIAFTLLRQFFNLVGARVDYIPCYAIASILIAQQIMSRKGWVVRPGTLGTMAVESVLLALPLLIAGQALVQYMRHTTLAGLPNEDRAMIVTFAGAGVYEEFVFRACGVTLLSLLFRDIFHFRPAVATALILTLSGVGFSLYHYLGTETFEWPSFLFRTAAGVYFSVLFLTRGFGVTAGTHAAYDVIAWSIA